MKKISSTTKQRASRRAAPPCSHVDDPDAYIDERGNIVIVGHDAWQRASYVDYGRAIPSAWIPLRRDHANPCHHAEPRFGGDSVDGVVGTPNQKGEA